MPENPTEGIANISVSMIYVNGCMYEKRPPPKRPRPPHPDDKLVWGGDGESCGRIGDNIL